MGLSKLEMGVIDADGSGSSLPLQLQQQSRVEGERSMLQGRESHGGGGDELVTIMSWPRFLSVALDAL